MRFSELIDAVRRSPVGLVIPAQWSQGRASFGGLVAALQYEAMRARVPADRPVRSLAITFVGPAAPDVPVSFQAEVLREGKAVSQVLGRAVQNGQVVTLVQGSFGASRASEVEIAAAPAPQMKHWDDCQELPYIPGVTPEFMRHLAMRWSIGGLPFTGNTSREMGGWVRLRNEVDAQPLSEAYILALVDAWPPVSLGLMQGPAPASSLTWTLELLPQTQTFSGSDWWSYLANIEHGADGYHHIEAKCWAPDGSLMAISRQTVTVFA